MDEEKFVDPLKAPFVGGSSQRYNDGATIAELMNWLNDGGVTNRNQKFYILSRLQLLTKQTYTLEKTTS